MGWCLSVFLDGVAGDSLNLGDRIHPNRDGIAVIVENILPTVDKAVGTHCIINKGCFMEYRRLGHTDIDASAICWAL